MPSPFPGMNPYLENPEFWPEVHHRLISAIADNIEPNLSQQYRVAIEKRTYTIGAEDAIDISIPDVSIVAGSTTDRARSGAVMTLPPLTEAVTVTLPMPQEFREAYLEIREIVTGRVVTVIEILSPANKRAGIGRNAYLDKREKVLATRTHLVEIDLLRNGKKMPIITEVSPTNYSILIARESLRPQAQLYAFSIRNEIPILTLPLQSGDTEPELNLQNLLLEIYDRARFDLTFDYSQEPLPPLKEEDRIWADTLLRQRGRRVNS
ncbi:MAG: DUF4058 family protein [Oscillatoriales cyanobacterium RU_3_3]|nr:DUF4058 family protein [Microcoleus sp. SU_5_6]NJL67638.1 DUF4058 family protein [Microcoleus sp. SM1_3_4]NJM60434.1 DUF4058 family protein [Oscillatoriales cyanobacterium RU_3_3]NJR24636.1 DUF4058 family protein [Richelia sp. CSU_2_1]